MDSSDDALGKVKYFVNEISSEIMNRDWRLPPRPWGELFEKFTFPKRDSKALASRVYLNLNYYQTNYVFVFAVVLIVFLLRHRWSLFIVAGITAGWVYTTSPKPIVIGDRRVTRKERFVFMLAVTVIVPTLTGLAGQLLVYLLFATAVVGLHAVFRHTNIRHKVSDIRQQVNDNW